MKRLLRAFERVPAHLVLIGVLFVSVNLWFGAVVVSYHLKNWEKERAENERQARVLQELAFPGSLGIRIEAEKQEREAARQEEKAYDERMQFRFNAAVAVAAFANIAIVFFQLRINGRQLRTQRAELRAYVSFQIDLSPEHDPLPNVEYVMRFSCRNHGKTPALAIGFRGGIWALAPTDSLPLIADGFDEERLNLFPDDTTEKRGIGFTPNTTTKFTREQIVDVMSGKKMYVLGLRVRYRDVFDTWHETQEFWGIRFIHVRKEPPTIDRLVAIIPGSSRIT